MQTFEFDTIVIGSGLAGLTAAYHSSKFGSVAVITKSELDTSNSYYAQGGIAAAIGSDDSPEEHMTDTFTAGRGLCDEDSVRILVNEGKERVLELIDMGMQFDKIDGNLVLGLEGAHSKRRILHADGDATGKKITCFTLQKVKEKKNITPFEYTTVVKLLKNNGAIVGVQALDFRTGENLLFKTKAVILATGGLSRIFARSTNPHTATGDGIALAWEAGARISDIEFIQFHPSALCVPGEEAYLISEAVRGEGAWLLDHDGKRFMKEIHPLAELAPRDVVAFNIFKKLKQSGKDFIYLSLKHLDGEKIKTRFHNIYLHLQAVGIDLTKDLVPVAPAAHYMVGGIQTNLDAETNIKGLFVCGEAASTGVMGANRLASNSLLECLVFGKRASETAAKLVWTKGDLPEIKPVHNNTSTENTFLEMQNKIASVMMTNLGIVRNKAGLEEAKTNFEDIAKQYESTNNDYNLQKIRNSATVCGLIAKGALTREESRGGHIRSDFPEEQKNFEVHIVQQKNKDIHFEPVRRETHDG
ncbi:L-aspartate oxidase [Mariniphaga anaerophila]|uniref:L-aspartate oxidase n=1 Tax=Mariniphaga anaerophila TaxID=1484053 RepID=A0A1M5C9B8_9BACT|nr:L-aspartate oxidase [Mariniphaga anaerophila]SHF51311.1 L-aspartate oxidase [Mariniphaga anaerophila]